MASEIHSLCDKILSHLAALKRPFPELVQLPLTDAEFQSQAAALPCVLPDSAGSIFTWHNGTRSALGMDFFPGYGFEPLVDAIDSYHSMCNVPELIELGYWNDHLFPLFASGAGDYYAIRCSDTPVPDGEVVSYEFSIGTYVEFVSLEAMLRTLDASYEAQVYFVDDNGRLKCDKPRFCEIARRFNPGVERWK